MIATVSPIANAQPRAVTTFSGRVVSIEVQPNNLAPMLIARISDGSALVEAVFLGRRDIPGVTPGAHLSVTGRLAATATTTTTGAAGATGTTAQMFNPRFELI